jgi:ankyrin repeat protein
MCFPGFSRFASELNLYRRYSVGGNSGYTPLHYAAREGEVGCVALLLRSRADVNRATAAGGATPLHRAAYTARRNLIQNVSLFVIHLTHTVLERTCPLPTHQHT